MHPDKRFKATAGWSHTLQIQLKLPWTGIYHTLSSTNLHWCVQTSEFTIHVVLYKLCEEITTLDPLPHQKTSKQNNNKIKNMDCGDRVNEKKRKRCRSFLSAVFSLIEQTKRRCLTDMLSLACPIVKQSPSLIKEQSYTELFMSCSKMNSTEKYWLKKSGKTLSIMHSD